MIKHHKYEQIEVSAFQKAKKGKACCGDSYFVNETGSYFICAVADGLGSGELAKDSSQKVTEVVKKHQEEDVGLLMKKCNQALGGKRGAVLSVFKIHFHSKVLEYCGIGNIRVILVPPEGKSIHPLPVSGFLSGTPANYRIQRFPFAGGSSFIAYSDGFDMTSKERSLLLNISSPTEISEHIPPLVENKRSDDVTFLLGKSV